MAAKPIKPEPATSSLRQTKTASIKPEQAFVDPLADMPLHGPITDRFTIQPDDITLITVGSSIHPSCEENETDPTALPANQTGKKPKDKTKPDFGHFPMRGRATAEP
jgi:hypothetical protein